MPAMYYVSIFISMCVYIHQRSSYSDLTVPDHEHYSALWTQRLKLGVPDAFSRDRVPENYGQRLKLEVEIGCHRASEQSVTLVRGHACVYIPTLLP